VPWTTNVLVVANVTADSDELLAALKARAQRGPTAFTLVLPPAKLGGAGRAAAEERLATALGHARDEGLQIDGMIGDGDPIVAVTEAFDPRRFDEIVVSTLPAGASRWLQVDLPHRVARLTGVPVKHVVAEERRAPARAETRRTPDPSGVLSPLLPLGWTAQRRAD
jgi:hypothetical protein